MKRKHQRVSSPLAELTISELRRGALYRAATSRRIAVGEYLGIETSWGDRSILLRTTSGTSTVSVDRIRSLTAAV